MAGYIRPGRRPGTWLVNLDLGRDAQGKRRYRARLVEGTERDARRVLRQLEADRDRGTLAQAPATLTVAAYLAQWLEAKRGAVRGKTAADYAQLTRLYIVPTLGGKRLAALSALDVQAWLTRLQAQGLGARTIAYAYAVLRASLRQAVRWGLLARNPAEGAQVPRGAPRTWQPLTPEQAARLLAVAREGEPDAAALLEFLLATGARPGEALALTWDAIDWERGVATVRQALSWRRGGWALEPPKTAQSRRALVLPASLVATLRGVRARQAARQLQAGAAWAGLGLVFCTRTGRPLAPRNVVRTFKRWLQAAGLPATTRLYDCRHSVATWAMASGAHPKVVAEQLGHSTVRLTLDTYSHVSDGLRREVAGLLERVLYERMP